MKNLLSTLAFVTVEQTKRQSPANAAVRQNGQIVFSKAANDIIGFPAVQYFRVAHDPKTNDIYLIPALATDADVLKGTKNNDSFQFRQDNVLAGIGAVPKMKYRVEKGVDGEGEAAVTYFKMTPYTKEDHAAEQAGETAVDPAKTDAVIAAKVEATKPGAKDAAKKAEAAARAAAKADIAKS